jgi:hypothetical protein
MRFSASNTLHQPVGALFGLVSRPLARGFAELFNFVSWRFVRSLCHRRFINSIPSKSLSRFWSSRSPFRSTSAETITPTRRVSLASGLGAAASSGNALAVGLSPRLAPTPQSRVRLVNEICPDRRGRHFAAGEAAIIDGEVVVFDDKGLTDFQALRSAMRWKPGRLVFVAFDLLHLEGEELRKLPLIERRARLAALLLSGESAGAIQFSEHVLGSGPAFYREVDRLGLEGMVSKRASSIYRSGRTETWVKTKCFTEGVYEVAGVLRQPGRPAVAYLSRRAVQCAVEAMTRPRSGRR